MPPARLSSSFVRGFFVLRDSQGRRMRRPMPEKRGGMPRPYNGDIGKTMNIFGILGSPRMEGNTDLLLSAYLEGAREAGASVEKIVLNKLDYIPCQGCGGCDKTGRCVYKDDMYSFYERLRVVDQLVVASPVYFLGVTAQTKAMIDRCQANWAEKYLIKRPVADIITPRWGVFISTSGMNKVHVFEPSKAMLRAFFSALDIVYRAEFTYPGIDARGEVKRHSDILDTVKKAGFDLAIEQMELIVEGA